VCVLINCEDTALQKVCEQSLVCLQVLDVYRFWDFILFNKFALSLFDHDVKNIVDLPAIHFVVLLFDQFDNVVFLSDSQLN